MLPPDRLPPARHRSRPAPEPEAATPPAEEASYEIGYGKPPVNTRFQPGQSGNPKGRKKGSKNLNTMVLGLLDERIPVNTPSGRRNVARIEMLLRKLIELGGKGNIRAIDQVLRQYALAQAASAPAATGALTAMEDVTATDAASLALLRELLVAEAMVEAGVPGGAS